MAALHIQNGNTFSYTINSIKELEILNEYQQMIFKEAIFIYYQELH